MHPLASTAVQLYADLFCAAKLAQLAAWLMSKLLNSGKRSKVYSSGLELDL